MSVFLQIAALDAVWVECLVNAACCWHGARVCAGAGILSFAHAYPPPLLWLLTHSRSLSFVRVSVGRSAGCAARVLIGIHSLAYMHPRVSSCHTHAHLHTCTLVCLVAIQTHTYHALHTHVYHRIHPHMFHRIHPHIFHGIHPHMFHGMHTHVS